LFPARVPRAGAPGAEMDEQNPVQVDVWFWPLDVSGEETERLSGLLTPEESARAARFFRPSDRNRWTVSRGRTRELLASVMGIAPATIAFGKETNGRPFIGGPFARIPSFNVSHSDGLGALAVCFDARVGLDVEAIRPISDAEIERALSPNERAELRRADPSEQLETFFRFWVLKESFMKGTGQGFTLPLHDFDIELNGPRLARLACDPAEPAHWRFAEAPLASTMRGAVTVRTDGRPMHVAWHTADGLNQNS
jgi:4'-phosphopantetheinyl transferase